MSIFAAETNLVASAKEEILFINVKSEDNTNCYVNNASKHITFICNRPIKQLIRNSLYYVYFREASFSADRKQISLPLKAKDIFAIRKSNDKNSFKIIGNKNISSKVELIKDTRRHNNKISKKIANSLNHIRKKNKGEISHKKLDISKKEARKEVISISKSPEDLNLVRVYSDDKFISLEFPIDTKIANAAFEREGYFWLVFNGKEDVDLSSMREFFSDIKIIPNDKNLIIRFSHNLSGYIRSEAKNNKWVFHFSRDKSHILTPITTLIEYSNPASLGLAFSVEKKYSAIRIMDPDIKDYITIIPMNRISTGIPIKRNFIDFNLLQTAQGLVIAEKADNIKFKFYNNYIEIISANYVHDLEGGIELRDVTKEKLQNLVVSSAKNIKTLLPYLDGNKYLEENFFSDKSVLLNAVTKSSSLHELNHNRLQLLYFFFRHNFFKEAFIYLNLIEQTEVDFFHSNIRLRFLKAVLYTLNNNNVYAVRIFDDIIKSLGLEKSFLDEVNLWKNYNLFLQGGDMKKMEYVKNINKFIFTYSLRLQSKIVLAELEYLLKQTNISKEDLNDVTYILDNMNPPEIYTDYFKNSFNFFMGRYYAIRGDTNIAQGYFQNLRNKLGDSYNRSRSEFELVKIQEKNEMISKADAINRLNKISTLWKGGDLEYDIMLAIANFYKEDKKLVKSMRAYDHILKNFPANSMDIAVTNNIVGLFNSIFKPGGYIEILDDFTVVSLFNEFRELTPIGSAGDQIVISVAKRLLNLDLLDAAEKLLRYQVDYRLKFDDKVSIANNLALLYIMNHKPQDAVEILNKTDKYNYSYKEYLERLRIKAHAFVYQNKYSAALKLILQDRSFDADLLREEIYFKEENWHSLIPMLELKIKDKLNKKLLFTEYEIKDLAKLTIGYAMTNNRAKLNHIKRNININNQNVKDVINYLSYYPKKFDYSDIVITSGISHFSEFLDIYKKKLF